MIPNDVFDAVRIISRMETVRPTTSFGLFSIGLFMGCENAFWGITYCNLYCFSGTPRMLYPNPALRKPICQVQMSDKTMVDF